MGRRWKTVLSFCLGVAVLAGVLAFAQRQDGGGEQGKPAEVSFSRPSGFYDAAFDLELSAEAGQIYYTLDSSNPDEHATLYTGPIHVQDASPNENVYSANTDTTVYLDKALLKKNGKKQYRKYRVPAQPVDKATVVRAVCVDPFGNPGPVSTAVYFVGFAGKTGYAGINVMTITTDPANLFDEEKGIYVLGKTFRDTLKDGVVTGVGDALFLWPANFTQKGKDWERPADIHCFDANGSLVFSGPCGIRIQGRATRAGLPKNMNIYARKKYGCAGFDTGGLFGNNYTLNRLNLYDGSNDVMLREYMVNSLTSDMDFLDREFCPCALFLDGEYWGVYWLGPRFKADYMSQKCGVREDNIVSIKMGEVDLGQEEDQKLYDDMVAYIADNDMRSPEAFERACELIDLQSCIDYYAVEVYIANIDWPTNNYSLWRSRRKASGAFSDGRWRWILFDLDHAMRIQDAELDTLKRLLNLDPMFASLMQNEAFSQQFIERLLQLAGDTFAPERTDAFIEAFQADMAAVIEKKYQRFYGKYDMDALFYMGCEQVRDFFRQRQAYIIKTYGGEE